VPEPCAHQHQRAVAVREAAYGSSAPPDLPADSFDPVIGADAQPMFLGVIGVGKRLSDAFLQCFCRVSELGFSKMFHHSWVLRRYAS